MSATLSRKQLLTEEEWEAHYRGLKLLCEFSRMRFLDDGPTRPRSEWRKLGEPPLEQWIYFLQAGDPNGPVKIGIARDVAKRIRGLQAAHYEDLWLRAVGPGDGYSERLLHVHYADVRIRGEWFSCSDDLHDHMGRLFRAYGRKHFAVEHEL